MFTTMRGGRTAASRPNSNLTKDTFGGTGTAGGGVGGGVGSTAMAMLAMSTMNKPPTNARPISGFNGLGQVNNSSQHSHNSNNHDGGDGGHTPINGNRPSGSPALGTHTLTGTTAPMSPMIGPLTPNGNGGTSPTSPAGGIASIPMVPVTLPTRASIVGNTTLTGTATTTPTLRPAGASDRVHPLPPPNNNAAAAPTTAAAVVESLMIRIEQRLKRRDAILRAAGEYLPLWSLSLFLFPSIANRCEMI
jgi:hypothetical protein